MRASNDLDVKYNDLNAANHYNNGLDEEEEDDEDDDDDDENDEGIQAFANLKQHEKTLLKTASRALSTTITNGVNQNTKSSHEIWLEYGCI